MDVENMLSSNPKKSLFYYFVTWFNIIGDIFPFILILASKCLTWILTTKLLRPWNEKIWAKNQDVNYADIAEYSDLLTYFQRDPKDFEPIWRDSEKKGSILSAVEGTVVSSGFVNNDNTANVLNGKFNIDSMLKEHSTDFNQYPFIVIFLAPTNIHNVYFPLKRGKLVDKKCIVGKYLLTNPYAIQYSAKVYEKNYRISFKFEVEAGHTFWICLISANCVGVIQSNLQIGSNVQFGDKIAGFLLGSTVAIISDNKNIKWKRKRGDGVNIMMELS